MEAIAAASATRHARAVSVRWSHRSVEDPPPRHNPVRTRLRLFQTSRDNPRPDLEVVSFDFVSAMTTSAPFLIAVTVE
jgi:hypothetical protein